jgi:hypothetical protein
MSDTLNVKDEKVRAPSVDALTFVRIYQTSGSVAEVSERTGLATHTVSQRASLYRTKRNINLKEMPRLTGKGARVDWDELRALADELRPAEEVSEEAEVVSEDTA